MDDTKIKRNYIFGAKATACGLYRALEELYPEKHVDAFIVSKAEGNPREIWGCPVITLEAIDSELSMEEKCAVCIFVAVPELIHEEIRKLLEEHGFTELVMIDSTAEADIMGRYFSQNGIFRSVHDLTIKNPYLRVPKLTVYAASFYKDKPLKNPPEKQEYLRSLYLGCDGAVSAGVPISNQADFYDNTGDNISSRNPNRCEMTAHYWIWKNRLDTDDEYVGVCHYRRLLDISDEDLVKMSSNDVDVVLPYPMLHYPNACIHHTWYVPEKDWELMIQIVGELYPEYAREIGRVFEKPEFYNYNMMIAKKQVFADYCEWIYPILDRIEELSEPKGCERGDRYTAYLSESLTTLYFMVNRNKLKIYHTGRLLYT